MSPEDVSNATPAHVECWYKISLAGPAMKSGLRHSCLLAASQTVQMPVL